MGRKRKTPDSGAAARSPQSPQVTTTNKVLTPSAAPTVAASDAVELAELVESGSFQSGESLSLKSTTSGRGSDQADNLGANHDVEYEDLQRNMRRHACNADESRRRALSVPPPNTDNIVKASDIARMGGFRVFEQHMRQNNGVIVAEQLEDAAETFLDNRAPQGLLADLTAHVDALLNFMCTADEYFYGEGEGQLTGAEAIFSKGRATLGLGRGKQQGLGYFKTSLAFFKSFVASGVFFVTHDVHKAGLGMMLVVMLFAMVFATVGMIQLAECARQHRLPFAELGRKAFGKPGFVIIAGSLVVSQTFFSLLLVIFAGTLLKSVWNTWAGIANAPAMVADMDDHMFWMWPLVFLAPLIPLSWLRSVNSLRFTNLLGDVCVVAGLVFLYVMAFRQIQEHGYYKKDPTNPKSEDLYWFANPAFVTFVAPAVYTFEGVGLLTSIQQAAAPYVKKKFTIVVWSNMVFLLSIICFTFAIAYVAWGNTIAEVSLNQMDPPRWDTIAADGSAVARPVEYVQEMPIIVGLAVTKTLFIFAVVLTVPISMMPPNTILESVLFGHMEPSPKRQTLKLIMRSLLVCFLYVCSLLGPQRASKLIEYLGLLVCLPIALLYPFILHLQLVGTQRAVSIGCIVIGSVLLAICMAMLVKEEIEHHTAHAPVADVGGGDGGSEVLVWA